MKHWPQIFRCRRLVIAAMLADGHLPRPEQFERAGLPALVPASDLVKLANQADPRDTPEAREWRANQRRRLSHPSF